MQNHPHADPSTNRCAVTSAYRERGKWHLAALIAILLLAAAVRFHDIARHPLWLDEYFSLQHSAGRGAARMAVANSGVRTPPPDILGQFDRAGYPAIWRGMADSDVHPPLYQVLLRVWRDILDPILGDGDAVVRALSAVLSIAAIALLWDIVRLLHGPAPALWAALLMTLATPQIHWAQDARPYTLLLALALGAIDAVVRLERLGPGRLRCAALALCTLGVGLTHYYGLPALFALGCYAAIRLRGRARAQAGVALVGGVAMFAALWGPSLLHQLHGAESQSGYLLDAAPGHPTRTLMRLGLLPARSLNEPSPRVAAAAALGAILFALPLLLRRRRPDLMLWAWWMAGALAPALVLDLAKRWEQLEYLRYSSLATPAFYALMASVIDGAAGNRRWLRHVLPAVAVLSCIVSLPRAYAVRQNPQPDYPWLAENFAARAKSGDVLVFHHSHDPGSPLLWYMAMSRYVPPAMMPKTVVFLMDEPNPAETEALRNATNVWSISDSSGLLPAGISTGRTRGHSVGGFNLPILQQWTE